MSYYYILDPLKLIEITKLNYEISVADKPYERKNFIISQSQKNLSKNNPIFQFQFSSSLKIDENSIELIKLNLAKLIPDPTFSSSKILLVPAAKKLSSTTITCEDVLDILPKSEISEQFKFRIFSSFTFNEIKKLFDVEKKNIVLDIEKYFPLLTNCMVIFEKFSGPFVEVPLIKEYQIISPFLLTVNGKIPTTRINDYEKTQLLKIIQQSIEKTLLTSSVLKLQYILQGLYPISISSAAAASLSKEEEEKTKTLIMSKPPPPHKYSDDMPIDFPNDDLKNAKMKRDAVWEFKPYNKNLRIPAWWSDKYLEDPINRAQLKEWESTYIDWEKMFREGKEGYVLAKYLSFQEITGAGKIFEVVVANDNIPYTTKIKMLKFLQLYWNLVQSAEVTSQSWKKQSLDYLFNLWREQVETYEKKESYQNIEIYTEEVSQNMQRIAKAADPKAAVLTLPAVSPLFYEEKKKKTIESGKRSLEDWEKDLPMNFPKNENYAQDLSYKEDNAKMRRQALRDFTHLKLEKGATTGLLLDTPTFQNYLLYQEKQYLADVNISETEKENYVLRKYAYYNDLVHNQLFFKETLSSELPYPIKIKVLQFLQLYNFPNILDIDKDFGDEINQKLGDVFKKWITDYKQYKDTKNFTDLGKNTEDARAKIEALYKDAGAKI